MEFRELGRTGVMVSNPCLGTMTFGWEPEDFGNYEEDALKVGKKALDLGINFFDTADVYGRGSSETILGKLIAGKRDSLVIATKCHGKMDDDDPNARGNSRRHIIEACHASLRRLGTDYIDLYQIHRPEPKVAIDETLAALDQLVRQGKVRYIGTSTYAGWQLAEAHYVAKAMGFTCFSSEQPPYNLLDRRIERGLLPFCRTYDYAVIPWSPLAGGQLTGKYLDGKPEGGRYTKTDPMGRINEDSMQVVSALNDLAKEAGLTLVELSLGWVGSQPGITVPIIGARSPDQLESTVKASQVVLDDDLMKKIDEIVPPGTNVLKYYDADFGPNRRPNC